MRSFLSVLDCACDGSSSCLDFLPNEDRLSLNSDLSKPSFFLSCFFSGNLITVPEMKPGPVVTKAAAAILLWSGDGLPREWLAI